MWFMSNKKTFCISLLFSCPNRPTTSPKRSELFLFRWILLLQAHTAGKSEKANLWSGTDPFESNLFLLLPDFAKIVFHLFPEAQSFRPSAALQLIHVGIDWHAFNGTHPFERGWKSLRWCFAREIESSNDPPIIRRWRSIPSSWVLWQFDVVQWQVFSSQSVG